MVPVFRQENKVKTSNKKTRTTDLTDCSHDVKAIANHQPSASCPTAAFIFVLGNWTWRLIDEKCLQSSIQSRLESGVTCELNADLIPFSGKAGFSTEGVVRNVVVHVELAKCSCWISAEASVIADLACLSPETILQLGSHGSHCGVKLRDVAHFDDLLEGPRVRPDIACAGGRPLAPRCVAAGQQE